MAKCYTISYDLDKPGQDYQAVNDYLKKIGAVKIELSQWLLLSDWTAFNIAKHLLDTGVIDGNDRLFVAEVSNNTAWYNLMITSEAMKKLIPAA